MKKIKRNFNIHKIVICIFLLFATNNVINAKITKEQMDKLNQDPIIQALMNNDYDKMRNAIKNGADADFALWRSVLISDGVHWGNTKMAEMLLKEFNADPNTPHRSFQNEVLLMKVESVAMLNLLIRFGANINAHDDNGKTPLIHQIKTRAHPEMIYAIIQAGADVNIRDKQGYSALDYAIQEQNGFDPSTKEGKYLIAAYERTITLLKKEGAK